jgi:alpha-beta hydrolase superfamily lysophospholipase
MKVSISLVISLILSHPHCTCNGSAVGVADAEEDPVAVSEMVEVGVMEGTFKSELDNQAIYYRSWNVEAPQGTIFIVHGMAEHSGRYAEFAAHLAETLRMKVVAHDHRGHGRTACPDPLQHCLELGMLQPRGISAPLSLPPVALLASDLKLIVERTSAPDHPVFVFGHSMGSVIVREYLKDGSPTGVILSGVPAAPTQMEYYALAPVANGITYLRGVGHEIFQNTFITGKFDQALRSKFGPSIEVGPHQFISSNPPAREAYETDEFAGHLVDLTLLVDVAKTLLELQAPEKFYKSSMNTPPILFICGRHDPVCNFGETARIDAQKMSANNFKVDEIYIGQCRHEFIHEIDDIKSSAINQVAAWIQSHIQIS